MRDILIKTIIMKSISISELTTYINEETKIAGVDCKFYNTHLHGGKYKFYPIKSGDKKMDGSWEILANDKGFEFVTEPQLTEDKLYLSIALIPENLLNNVTLLEWAL